MDSSRNSGYSSLSYTPLPHSFLGSPGFAVRILGSTGSLTLHFKRDTTLSRTPVPFDLPVSPQTLRAPRTPSEESPMHSSLRSSSAQSFVINTRLGDSPETLSALIDSGATETFLSNRLALLHQDIAKPLELQLFDRHPAPSGPITKSHSSTLTLDNGLRFPVNFLVTQLHESTSILLGLPWLRNVNPNIDWATLTMKFDTPGAELAAAIHLLPSPNLDNTEPRDASNTPEPRSPTPLPALCPPNIPRNKYKGPNYPTRSLWSTPKPTLEDVPVRSR
ncbi:hypothetical protein C0992_010953 [Termitomyces sp. T32_za158]|nr:hypothetical protein C0992_010953 [Termitomyces sp. T32_za158]